MSDYPPFDGTQHCAQPGVDPERFHPGRGANGSTVEQAKVLCKGDGTHPPCPFLDGCREYGVTHSVSGLWGGWGENQRKEEQKRRRIVPEPLSFGDIAGRAIHYDVVRVHASHAGVKQHERAGEKVCDECAQFRREARRERENRKKAS